MSSPIDTLIKETKAAFYIAKSDGNLDASEVIQIAIALSQKIQKLANLSGSEKKSLLLLTLKKGLETSGGISSLPGFAGASADVIATFETQLLMSASTTIDALCAAANGKLDLRKPANWKFCLPMCMTAVQTLMPKDQVHLNEAIKLAENLLTKNVDTTTVTTVESSSVTLESSLPGAVSDEKK